jgi:hypothetical protein
VGERFKKDVEYFGHEVEDVERHAYIKIVSADLVQVGSLLRAGSVDVVTQLS